MAGGREIEISATPTEAHVASSLRPIHIDLPAAPHLLADQAAQSGDALYSQDRLVEALERYIEAARLAPQQPRNHFMLALCAWQTSRLELVEAHLKDAVRLQPDQPIAHHVLADWYLSTGDATGALFHSAKAVALAPTESHVVISRACILQAAGQDGSAWELVCNLVRENFPSARLAALYSRMAPAMGHEHQAWAMLERLLNSPQVARIEHRLLHFAAANLLERIGRYDEAFANARMAQEICPRPYDRRQMSDWVDRRIAYHTPRKLHDLPRASHRSRRPVFIIGMPRSGTSLVEQILASHPQVHGAGELRALSRIALEAAKRDPESQASFPECLDSISLRAADRMANDYLKEIASLNGIATYVTDKMPMNFLYLGMIATLFPDAHVIQCTRDPLDTCLSCYMTDFSIGHEFAQGLTDLGCFYRDYRRLIRHWTQVLNFPMLEVKYEDVVADLEGQTRRMLEFLDLPWDSRCLNFHQTSRPVLTASRDQIRRPLYKTSVGRWKHYREHLRELEAALGEVV